MFKREPTEDNPNAYRIAGLRLIEICDTVKRTHLGDIMSPRLILKHRLNLYEIGLSKSKERNPVTLFINDRDVTSHRDIANTLTVNVSHNSSSAFSTDAFTSVRNKAVKPLSS